MQNLQLWTLNHCKTFEAGFNLFNIILKFSSLHVGLEENMKWNKTTFVWLKVKRRRRKIIKHKLLELAKFNHNSKYSKVVDLWRTKQNPWNHLMEIQI